jgi:hypothetical protein
MRTTDELYAACSAFVDPAGSSLWDRLSAGASYQSRDGGHASAKSRPPATLSLVALVIEASTAVRESTLDLVGTVTNDLRVDLSYLLGELDTRADDDLIDWWCSSLVDWTQRASQMLGRSRVLLRELRGAVCPYCSAQVVRTRVEREWFSRPAIVVDWDSDELDDVYQVHSLHCRACDAQWLRGVELDELIARQMRANLALAVLTFEDTDNPPDVLVACEGRTGGVSPVRQSPLRPVT